MTLGSHSPLQGHSCRLKFLPRSPLEQQSEEENFGGYLGIHCITHLNIGRFPLEIWTAGFSGEVEALLYRAGVLWK